MNESIKETALQKKASKLQSVANATGTQGKVLIDNRPSSILQKKANNTGLPDNLKSGIENLSGHSMDDVKVHYNSDKPAQLNAHAYAQGSEIHLASGQEKHLPHEAWHVVQQKQGRVKPTLQMKGKVNVNDDAGLEKEADIMGSKALSSNGTILQRISQNKTQVKQVIQAQGINTDVVQRVITVSNVKYQLSDVSKSDKQKMIEVTGYLKTSLSKLDTPIKRVAIKVNNRSLMDPARTWLNGDKIEIDLGIDFVKISSVGDISGMLAHEIGVHNLADEQMSWPEKNEEEQHGKHPFSVRVGLHKHVVTPWVEKTNWGGRQKDHVNVMRDKGQTDVARRSVLGDPKKDVKGNSLLKTGFDENSVNNRAVAYAETMLRLGDAIENDPKLSQTERDKRLHDLLSSFLFDYARMLATDDVAMHVADKTPLVAQVFNWYKKVIIVRHGAAHTWLNRKSMQPTASTWGLRAYLTGKLTQSLSVKYLPTKVHNAMGSVWQSGSSMLSTVGNAVSSITPNIVKTGGSMLATGTKKALRVADYAYGEAENLVVPNVVWGTGKIKSGIGRLSRYLGLLK